MYSAALLLAPATLQQPYPFLLFYLEHNLFARAPCWIKTTACLLSCLIYLAWIPYNPIQINSLGPRPTSFIIYYCNLVVPLSGWVATQPFSKQASQPSLCTAWPASRPASEAASEAACEPDNHTASQPIWDDLAQPGPTDL